MYVGTSQQQPRPTARLGVVVRFMTCQEARRNASKPVVALFLALSEEERRALMEHLRECKSCKAYLEGKKK